MKAIDLLAAGAILAALLSLSAWEAHAPECHTDTECAELCPTGTRDLSPDHPDYCDGGPQP